MAFNLTYRMGAENIGEFGLLLGTEASDSCIVWDLNDRALVDQDVVNFLSRCEVDGIHFKNSPAYILE